MKVSLAAQIVHKLTDLQKRMKEDVCTSRKGVKLLLEAASDLAEAIGAELDSHQSASEEITMEKYLHLRSLSSAQSTSVFPDFSLPENLVQLYDIRRASRGKAEQKLDKFCQEVLAQDFLLFLYIFPVY